LFIGLKPAFDQIPAFLASHTYTESTFSAGTAANWHQY
jgi:hypothetical protein